MGTAFTTVEVLVSDLEHSGGKKAVPLVSFVKWLVRVDRKRAHQRILRGHYIDICSPTSLCGSPTGTGSSGSRSGVRQACGATDAGVSALRWTNDLDRDVVDAFVQEQRGLDYDLFSKNCKHFAYDLLTRAGLVESKFECFCQRAELAYRSY